MGQLYYIIFIKPDPQKILACSYTRYSYILMHTGSNQIIQLQSAAVCMLLCCESKYLTEYYFLCVHAFYHVCQHAISLHALIILWQKMDVNLHATHKKTDLHATHKKTDLHAAHKKTDSHAGHESLLACRTQIITRMLLTIVQHTKYYSRAALEIQLACST